MLLGGDVFPFEAVVNKRCLNMGSPRLGSLSI